MYPFPPTPKILEEQKAKNLVSSQWMNHLKQEEPCKRAVAPLLRSAVDLRAAIPSGSKGMEWSQIPSACLSH